MHNFAKEIMEVVKTKAQGKGIDNIEGKDLEEFKTWACIAKDIAEYDYYYHITEAMEESEYGEDYDENGRKGYRMPRDSRGRYMRRGYENRMYEGNRGYDEMDDDMMGYRGYSNPMNREMSRDMDRSRGNVMYYPQTSESRGQSYNRGYEEVNDAESLKKVFEKLEKDIMEVKSNMSPQDKANIRQKMTEWANLMS